MSTLEYLSEHRLPAYVGIAAILLASVLAYMLLHTGTPRPAPAPPHITTVVIQPPKPPPPPPPLPQPKTIVQPKMVTPVQKPVAQNQPPKAAAPKPTASPAPPLGTSLKSNGTSNAFDLSGSGNGNGIIGGSGAGGGDCDSDCGSYESAVTSAIRDALGKNPKTKFATIGMVVRIWVDGDGVITRVALAKSSGDPALDDVVENQALRGLALGAPPAGTPMPIIVRMTGEQPLQ